MTSAQSRGVYNEARSVVRAEPLGKAEKLCG